MRWRRPAARSDPADGFVSLIGLAAAVWGYGSCLGPLPFELVYGNLKPLAAAIVRPFKGTGPEGLAVADSEGRLGKGTQDVGVWHVQRGAVFAFGHDCSFKFGIVVDCPWDSDFASAGLPDAGYPLFESGTR